MTICEARLQRLADESDIRHLLYAYCRGVDRDDDELIASVYHPDATDNHGSVVGAVADFLNHVRARRTNPVPEVMRRFHMIGNIMIDVAGEEAQSEAYFLAYHRRLEQGAEVDDFVAGRYLDIFTRRDGRWGIADRRVVFDWSRVDPAGRPWWDGRNLTPFLFGAQGTADPLYERGIATFG